MGIVSRSEIVERAKAIDPPICGIYFLLQDNEVVYVGQSVDILKRITQHAGKKVFNRYHIEPHDQSVLSDMEAEYIVMLLPRYNTTIPVNSKWTTWNVLLRDHGPHAVARLNASKIKSTNGYYLISDFAGLPRFGEK